MKRFYKPFTILGKNSIIDVLQIPKFGPWEFNS